MKRLAPALIATAVLALAPAAHATLIHEWQGNGNANDSVGTNNGSLFGDTTFTTGVSGQAFSFDGAGDDMEAPDDPSHYFTGSFTIDAWEKTTDGSDQHFVFAIYECGMFCPTNQANSAAIMEVFNNQAYGFVRDTSGLGPDGGGQQLQAGPNVADGAFHHIVFIRDVDAMKLALYIDGTEVSEEALDPGAAGALQNEDGEADPLTIGAAVNGGTSDRKDFFDGAIDDVRLFDSANYPDTTPPSVSPALTGPLGNAGWYVGDVQAGWTISTASVVRSSSGCGTVPITADTAGTALTCQATTAGGTGSGSVTVRRDATPPTLTCSAPTPSFAVGAGGKTVSAAVHDSLSGPAAASASAPAITSSAGHRSVTITGSDVAGNTTSVSCPYAVAALTNVSITSLRRCLPSGPFNYRFKVPLKKLVGGRKVNRRSRVSKVQFRIDGKRDGSDRKRPFIANINVSKLSDGAHVLSADVRLRVPGTRKTFKRRQKFAFRTCV